MWVIAGPKAEAGRVCLWDVDEAHPNGEVLIAAPHKGQEPRAVEVAETPAVLAKMAEGVLVESSKAGKVSAKAMKEAEEEAKPTAAEQHNRLASMNLGEHPSSQQPGESPADAEARQRRGR